MPIVHSHCFAGSSSNRSGINRLRIWTCCPCRFAHAARAWLLHGTSATPKDGESFAEAYEKASGFAEFVPVWGRPTPFYIWHGSCRAVGQNICGTIYTRQRHVSAGTHELHWHQRDSSCTTRNVGATLANPAWRNAYKEAAIDVVRAARPFYLSLGNEVNRWYEKYGANASDPNGFQNYVSLYSEIYDAVKELSPQTNVFCTFVREVVAENREADLSALNLFEPSKMDVLIFISYSYALPGIDRPDDIPDDYYARILDYMPGKPFGLSEFAWAALEEFGGEQAQVDFVFEVAGRLTAGQGINLEFLGWPWLAALDEEDPVALIKRNGMERLAFAAWQTLFSSA